MNTSLEARQDAALRHLKYPKRTGCDYKAPDDGYRSVMTPNAGAQYLRIR